MGCSDKCGNVCVCVCVCVCAQHIKGKTQSGQLDRTTAKWGEATREWREYSARADRELRTRLVEHVERVGKISKSLNDTDFLTACS